MDTSVAGLIELGFTSYEAKVYVALLKKQPAIGYEVSKVANIPTAKVYEVLTNLKSKGAVMASASEPVYYSALPYDILLERMHKEVVQKIENLRISFGQIEPLPVTDLTWNLSTKPMVMAKMAEVIAHTRNTLMLSLWPQEVQELRDAIVLAQSRGVFLTAGIFGECELDRENTVNLETCGKSSRKRLQKRLSVVVGDSTEVVIAEFSEEEAIGVYTAVPSIVLVAKEYIKHDIWGKALIDAVGQDRFTQICADSAILSFLIQNP